ncbi:MAG: histidinol-phosphate transaminase [Candidatus Gastranaerophilales bacterium]|nr:histidinol-phosphate transaminase [Candidatus Gastranaerophilales bacterium]
MILPKKTIINTQGYDVPLFLDDCLMKLDFNENLLGPSPKVIEALKNISKEEIKFYPAIGELLSLIANLNNVENSMVMATNGADEAINYIFDTFIEQNDDVVTLTPTFTMPKVYAKSTGCNYKEIKYTEKWVFPVEEFLSNIDEKTRLVIVTTPNSPTGEVISRENLIKIIKKAENSIVMIDETYSSFAKEQFHDLTFEYKNVIITRSMSKDYALAGLRIGYIISAPENIEYIRRIISPYSVNALAAKAAIAALNDKDYFNWMKEQINQSKKILSDGLKAQGATVYPSETNFLCVDFGDKAEFIYKRLLNSGIKVKYFSNDPDLKNCFRITVPAPEQSKIFLDTLKKRDLIIFDMDGVLVDTSNSYRMAIKETYRHFAGKDISFDEIQKAKNNGGLNNDWECTEYLLINSGINIPKNEVVNKFQELYFADNGTGYILNESLLVDPLFLKSLAKNNDLAIFTGRPRAEAEFVLKRWNLEDLFSMLVAMEDVPDGFHKPEPYGIKQIQNIISSLNVYYLGDTPDDMTSAAKANVKGVGILPPQDKSEDLKNRLLSEGAVIVLNNIQEFTGINI